MTYEREGWGKDGPQLIIHNQLISLKLPDFTRFGVVSDESCTAIHNDFFLTATKNISFVLNDMLCLEMMDTTEMIVFVGDLLESCNEQIDQKNVGDEEENKHTEGGDPRSIHTAIGVTHIVRTS